MTPNATLNESVIRKIQALLRLTQSPNEHEASLAAVRIQEILTTYNLDMAEVESAGQKSADLSQSDTGKRSKEAHGSSAMYQYQQSLMKALARNNFCEHWIQDNVFKADPRGKQTRWEKRDDGMSDYSKPIKGRFVKTHMLIGREVNVIVTKLTYDYLIETMDRLLPYTGMEKRGKSALLWLAGCSDRLVERLDELRREREAETRAKSAESTGFVMTNESGEVAATGGSTALVRLTDLYQNETDLNNDLRWGFEPGSTTRRRLEHEAKSRAMEATIAKLRADDPDLGWTDAWNLAHGYPIETKTDETVKTETPAQKAKREEREARDSSRYWERQERKERQRKEKLSSSEYRAGAATAKTIGLDPQVKSTSKDRKPTTKEIA